MNKFSDMKIPAPSKGFEGEKIKISKVLNREIEVHGFKIDNSKCFSHKGSGKCLTIQIRIGESNHIIFTSSSCLIETIQQIPKEAFPFATTIVEDNDRYMFT
jgi:hypothetical protein